MKTKRKPDQSPEWDFNRNLVDQLRGTTRLGLSAQVLVGKESALLKAKLGFTHGSQARFSPSRQRGDLDRTWDEWCKVELGLPARTVDRYIQCFYAALKRAKEPEARRLLKIPAAELNGDEVERLAACVDRLVDQDTQAGLLEELGIVKPSNKLPGGANSGSQKSPRRMSIGEWAFEISTQIDLGSRDLEQRILNFEDSDEFKEMLSNLDLEIASDADPEALTASLKNTKNGLELARERIESGKSVLNETHERISKIIKDVEDAIESKMSGPPPKESRKKTRHLAGK